MKKGNTLLIKILFVSLAVLLIAYFMFTNQSGTRYQWQETYESGSDQPYGTSFIKQLLEADRPGQRFVVNDKKPLSQVLDTALIKTKTDYVLIGQDIFLDEPDREALLNFIAAGNDAFIATVNLPFDLVDRVFVPECDKEIFLKREEFPSATLNFYNVYLKSDSGYSYVYRFKGKNLPYYWSSLNPEIFCDSTFTATPLGYIHPEGVNFLKLSYGKGNLFIHSNPVVFTNYFITDQRKAVYAAQVFSHLKGDSMIWDDFSKLKYLSNNAPDMSPIAFLLQQESLRYAWWMMLAAVLLYVLFTAKRRQRVIPVLEEKTNTSLEFVSMVSALHFENRFHLDIARKKMRYFYHFIRVKYNIHTHGLSESHLKRLAEKSKVSAEDLEMVSIELKKLEKTYYNESDLVELHLALEKFYKQCK